MQLLRCLLFSKRGIDSVITLARRIPVTDAESVKVLDEGDLLIHWKKPVRTKASSYSQADWEDLPESLLLRQIKVTVNQPGFRVNTFYMVTTLLDAEDYPANALADLYFQRWNVELFFRDIKTTMGMDILRCKTPDMVRKEVLMHLIVYNCIRCIMLASVDMQDVCARRISFKGSVQALRQWEPHLNQRTMSSRERNRLIRLLYAAMTKNLIPDRPGRSEPRAVKRRPKPFQLLTAPRHEMIEIKHRSKYRANAA